MPRTVASNGTTRHAKPSEKPWRRASEFVNEIWDRRNEPWVTLGLGLRDICKIRPGGIVAIMGPPGGGKSSFVCGLLLNHARHHGPAVYLSCELPGDEAVGRQIGMQADASWEDVLVGRVTLETMEQVMDLPRLYVIERQNATIDNLVACLTELRKDHRHEPILAAGDYMQIMPSPGDEPRNRIESVMMSFDSIARLSRSVLLAVNQMSRTNAKVARSGDALGNETSDMGAESSSIERWATTTITLGGYKIRADGSDDIQINVGKGRMDGGDRVYPGIYDGRTGRFAVVGEPRAAAVVRAEREAQKQSESATRARMAVMGAAAQLLEPVSRKELAKDAHVGTQAGLMAIEALVREGKLVEVGQRAARSKHWKVCTPELARSRQLPLLEENPLHAT